MTIIERVFELVERRADLDEFAVGSGTADAGRATHRFFVRGEFGHWPTRSFTYFTEFEENAPGLDPEAIHEPTYRGVYIRRVPGLTCE